MWMWIVGGVAALAAVVYGVWPRKGGVDDSAVLRGRQGTHGAIERDHNTNFNDFPY